MPITSKVAKYQFATVPHDGLNVGETSSWNTVLAYAKNYGYIAKDGKDWLFAGEKFGTQKEIVDMLHKDTSMLHELKMKLIAESVEFENKIGPSD